jgi:hypothetical protein
MPDDGYLHVASFVDVVWYPKDLYPKGVKKYEVKQGQTDEAEQSKD